jgi:hypothetical protein
VAAFSTIFDFRGVEDIAGLLKDNPSAIADKASMRILASAPFHRIHSSPEHAHSRLLFGEVPERRTALPDS